ncbi:MAG TPA: thiamine pyrophosphate-binding protein, partial [Burkholderiaceae bacterium]|nr:thiamine pyrophosphate-binding protein [Burkholderiaceae bacterium]
MSVVPINISGIPRVEAVQVEVADLIISYLEQIGVEYVFGVPGGAIEPLYNALARSQRRGGPRSIVARHEAGAAFMADGYARETGKIGVCIATSGPGATNLITGVACAYDNGVPLLVLTGQPPLPAFGRRALQESACTGVNVPGMFEHCTRYNSLVSHADQLETKLVNALSRAWHTPKGPAHLSIPVDILRGPAISATPTYDLQSLLLRQHELVDQGALRRLAEEFTQARRIVFLLGSGCSDAIEMIMQLIRQTKAAYVTTPDAKGFINPKESNYYGVFGFAGHAAAEEVLRDGPDLVVAMGITLGEWTSGGWSTTLLNDRLVHIDSCQENLTRSPMARMHVRGHIPSVCEYLIEKVRKSGRNRLRPIEPKTMPRRDEPLADVSVADKSDAVPIKPQRLMRELSERCPPNTCFVADAGNSAAWAVHYLELGDRRSQRRRQAARQSPEEERRRGNGWLRVTMDFAPMGWAIGAAVGIARANPATRVVCLTGDGSYLMNGQEITVAAQEKLPVLFIVLNDAALGMVKHGQRLAGAEQIGFELPQVDFRLLAESLGIP